MQMAKQKDSPKLVKKSKLFRFTPDTIRRLAEASAKAGMSETVYAELALKAQFKKDAIP